LRQSQKLEALGTFAGGIAHDFNNILGAIIGYGELAIHSLTHDAPQRRYIEQVLKAGDRARSLVERILTFSRSAMTIREPVPVQETVSGSIELFKVSLPESIDLEVHLEATGAYIAGDPAHLDQVVMNLCGNAVHAMTDGGTLGVELTTVHLDAPRSLSHGAIGAGEFVRLAVIDTGTGIPTELLERIFNPFFTTRKAGEGTGLGLSLVDAIAREYGGGVDVHTVVGKGTRFEVFLPLIEATTATETNEGSTWRHGEGQTILLVDDEEALVGLGEEILAEFGYEPVGFTSSTAAWKAFEANPQRFDAVLTDHTMPDMTGIELAIAIKRCRADIPIILASGYGSAALERDAEEAGVQTVLRKPLRKAELAHALSQALYK
jgi:CheY-like chemotaxis protein